MLILLSLLAACKPAPTDDTADSGDTGATVAMPGTTVRGEAERVTTPSTADLPTLGAENADFSLDIVRQLLGTAPPTSSCRPGASSR